MTKLGDALRRKFKTPEETIKALGLDASVLKTVMAGDKALAFDTLHPDFSKVKHLAAVQAAVRKYQEAVKANRGTYENGGRAQKEAEEEINRQVEKALSPKGAHDSSRKELNMSKTTLTRKASMLMGGLHSFLKPKMAKDAKLDWGKLLGTITTKNFASKKGAIVAGVKEQTKGKLAKDASIDGLVELLDGFEKVEGEDDLEPNGGLPLMGEKHSELEDKSMDDADPHEGLKKYLGGKGMSEDDIAGAIDALGPDEETPAERNPAEKLGSKGASEEGEDEKDDEAEDEGGEEDAAKFAKAKDKSAKDEPPPFKGKPEVGGGMSKDSVNKAIKVATDAALKEERERNKALREAERFVRPWVGDLAMAHDSAEGVYKTALGALGVDTKGLHPSAYKALLEHLPKPGNKNMAQDEQLGLDSSSVADFNSRYPGAAKIGHA